MKNRTRMALMYTLVAALIAALLAPLASGVHVVSGRNAGRHI